MYTLKQDVKHPEPCTWSLQWASWESTEINPTWIYILKNRFFKVLSVLPINYYQSFSSFNSTLLLHRKGCSLILRTSEFLMSSHRILLLLELQFSGKKWKRKKQSKQYFGSVRNVASYQSDCLNNVIELKGKHYFDLTK